MALLDSQISNSFPVDGTLHSNSSNLLYLGTLDKKAQITAATYHQSQKRRDGYHPYFFHLQEVVKLLRSIGIKDSDTIASAWLHDIIEDTNITENFLKIEFNYKIANNVHILTRNINRKKYLERLKIADVQTQLIKLADMIHNTSDHIFSINKTSKIIKIQECKDFYFDLSKKICPTFHILLLNNIKSWSQYK